MTKTSFVKSLQLLYPKKKFEYDIIGNEFDLEIFMDKVGSLIYWIEDAADEKKWQWMIDSKLRFPHLDIPEPNRADPPPPFPPRNDTPPPNEHSTPPRRRQRNQRRNHPPTPPNQNPAPSPPRNRNTRDYDPGGVGQNLADSFAILGFSLEDNVSERQVRRRHIEMARKYPPDKNNPAESGRNQEEATVFFQLLNNAQSHLCNWL